MKKAIIILSIVLSTINSIGQITLEHTYTNGNSKTTMIKLSNSGLKYQWVDVTNGQLKLYNLDHSIFKTMSFPVITDMSGIWVEYVSETTFDTDNEIEFMVYYQDDANWANSATKIINETGAIILDKAGETPAISVSGDKIEALFNTVNGTKMILDSYNDNSSKVYSLPGTLVATNITTIKENYNLDLVPYPNPTNTSIKLAYTLPENIKEARVSIFNSVGAIIKTYYIDHNYKELLIETTDLKNGIYYCQIDSDGRKISSTEFIVGK